MRLTAEQFYAAVSRATANDSFQAACQDYAHRNGTSQRIAIEALRAALGEPATGLNDAQRLAIAAGNEPYADEMVCPTCDGHGFIGRAKSQSDANG